MIKKKIEETLTELARKRPVFHSEADFQHSLAWEIHKEWPDCSLRLEKPIQLMNYSAHLDIWAGVENAVLAIELKYKTWGLNQELEGEKFELLDHRAQDCGRYDFIKDIERLEQIASKRSNIHGYAILLTNDRLYWSPPTRKTVDAQFRIHQGKTITGELRWRPEASEGTTKGRKDPIVLKDEYYLEWQNYSKNSNYNFRYLLVEVKNQHK